MTNEEKWLLEEKYGGTLSPAFEADCKRLASGEPLAYVIGWQPFLGLKIYLDSKPLIPRVETEWWTEQLLKESSRACSSDSLNHKRSEAGAKFPATGCPKAGPGPEGAEIPLPLREQIRFLDLCAGSGAIGCAALARLPNAHVSFGEIDPAHEATIEKNIRENGLDRSRVEIRIGDLFKPFGAQKFDIIAVNPPYIPAVRALDPSVSVHEPHQALFSGANGLDETRRLATGLPKHLAKGGQAWVEVDSPAAEAAAGLFRAQGFDAEIRTDQFGRPRVIVVRGV